MLDTRIQRRSQWALVALLGLAMALSHYSTTYVAITLIGLTLPLQWVLSWFREIPRVTGAVAVAFIAALAGAFIWYGPVTQLRLRPGTSSAQTVATQGLDVLPNRAHGESLLSAYLQGNTATPISAAQYAQLVNTYTRCTSPSSHRSLMLAFAGTHLHNASPPTPPVRWRAGNSALSWST